jgi:protein required for attachment to host cells
MKLSKTWAVAADGSRATVVEGWGDPSQIHFTHFHQETPPPREIMADRPGRSFSSTSDHRSGMEPKSNPVREREKDFAHRIADYLDEHVRKGHVERLMVFAEPRMLGALREEMPENVRGLVSHEIGKNLTHLDGKHLVEAMDRAIA